jgi:hypothetical protein
VIGSVIALSCRRPWASQKPLKNRLIRLKSQTETKSTVPRDTVDYRRTCTRAPLNRESERIPRRLRRGKQANPKKTAFLTVEDSLQLAAGNLQKPVPPAGRERSVLSPP